MGDGTWVGLDVHAKSVRACVIDGSTGEVRSVRAPHESDALVGWVKGLGGTARVAYEAGPTGFGLARALERAGIPCVVVAPSRIARSPADRGRKSDAADAERLARLLRVGDLVAVAVPDVADEAARDLVRAREDARGDLMRARHRLSKLLLRYGHVYEGRAWTQRHDEWLRAIRLEHAGSRAAQEHYYAAVLAALSRRDALDAQIERLAAEPRWAEVVARLGCLRGVSTLTALGLAVEVGDWHRLSGRTIGAYLGLVPIEHQSGERHTRAGITKSGNGHARRLLVEAAWHQRRPIRPSRELERRRQLAPAHVRSRAERAERRLNARWRHLEGARGLRRTIVAVAVAREMAAHCWDLAVMDA